ncbi:MAG: transglycosylase domain-containing protein [Deltaproteobacteria bacterium]|nr:transglycosylase domain-containing protein [Deltaproteobacteria bacterium]MBN2670451.1 transglycosylase domain-containing protein [Deltaproteobacteria bacterium]
MGIKRWLLALLILVVVLVFIFFIFLQTGADKQIAEVVIPRIEDKFGVTVTYDSVSVSLTSVSFEQVVLSPTDKNKRQFPFAKIDRLGVNFRVGPLLLGKLDITGVRIDGLHVLIGDRANGAAAPKWKQLLDAVKSGSGNNTSAAADSIPESLKIPEVYIVSGDIAFNDNRFIGTMEELTGRITPGNKAIIQTRKWTFGDGKRTAAKGEHLEIEYDYALKHIAVDLERPDFAAPADREAAQKTIANVQTSLSELGLYTPKASDKNSAVTEASALDVVVHIHNASGAILGQKSDKLLELTKINAELLSSNKMLVSARASGGLTETDARWAMQGSIPKQGSPSLVLEVPDLPLKNAGRLLFDNAHVDWSNASADGQIKVTMAEDKKEIVVEGQTSLAGLTLSHERISPNPLTGVSAMFDYKTSYNTEEQILHLERALVSRGSARVTFRGDIHFDRLAFDIEANVPSTSCRQIFEAIPSPLRDQLTGVELEGRIGVDMRMAFDAQKPDEAVLDGTLDNRCKISNYGAILRPDDLRRPFAYMAYDENGKRIRLTTGPGTNRWTPYQSISPFLVAAVLTTEDGKFEFHKGLTLPEIRSALIMNLKKEGMFHGGSTITMQLAKNLFLSRDRTLSRKVQELFFVWFLESNFTKDEILELYFNVIEFGPSLYGIGEAAYHYFGREPNELNLLESVFLIKLLPNPVERHKVWEQGNTLNERKNKSLQRVLATMLKRKRISELEFNEGMRQTISFFKEGMPLPEPRVPVNRSFAGADDEYYENAEDFDAPMDDSW